ncbi:MAG: divalent metal cation transporter [Flavobacteriaceae bacterium]|nr:divalent metal cation transporter [Flavobacteriaceae bacterium]
MTWLKKLGPGILLAGAAIGVSHLVQSTRAGAEYGWVMFIALVVACASKYPFLDFGTRYTAATGKNLLYGYRSLGKPALYSYGLITLGTMFIILAAVTLVAAGLAENLFQLGWSVQFWSILLLGLCVLIILGGKYSGLDLAMKIILGVLAVAVISAVVLALAKFEASVVQPEKALPVWSLAGLSFVFAFMGWMPIPLDASVWHSIWILEKKKSQTNTIPTQWLSDFKTGYFTAVIMAVLFFTLGNLVLFGKVDALPDNAVAFSAVLIELFSENLGGWSKRLISFAAFTAMFSTVLSITDAYPRVGKAWLRMHSKKDSNFQKSFLVFLLVVPAGALCILFFLFTNFKSLIDFATGITFLSAPVLAWFNLKLIQNTSIPFNMKPTKNYLSFSKLCLLFLIFSALVYLLLLFL